MKDKIKIFFLLYKSTISKNGFSIVHNDKYYSENTKKFSIKTDEFLLTIYFLIKNTKNFRVELGKDSQLKYWNWEF